MKTLILRYCAIFAIGLAAGSLYAQNNVAINTDGSAPDPSAMLDIKSSTSGLLIPRMTTLQRTAITLPASGLMVYDTNTNTFWCYTGSSWVEVLSGYVSILTDADGDTKVDVEESPDEDTIRFYTGGLEHLKMGGGRLQVLNTGGSVFLGEGAGKIDDLSNFSVFIGKNSGGANTTGNYNTAIGTQSLELNTSGFQNTAFGYKTLPANTTQSYNTAIGAFSLYKNDTGSNNTALGSGSLYNNLFGHYNVAIGKNVLYQNQTGGSNVGVGSGGLYANISGHRNTALGYNTLYSNTVGSANIAVGVDALHDNTDRNNLVAVGDSALFNNGTDAIDPIDATGNTALGSKAMYANATGYHNTATGYEALYSNTTGRYNVANGYEALFTNTEGRLNTAVGYRAMYSNTIGNLNSAYGYLAMYSNTEGRTNTAMGYRSMYFNTTGAFNVAIGARALYSNDDRSNLVAIGDSALYNNGIGVGGSVEATGNTGVGSKALYANTTGYHNTATGYQVLYSNSTGYYNTGYGYGSLYSNTTGSRNTASGHEALYLNTTGDWNTGSGYRAMYQNTDGSYNAAFGYQSMQANTGGDYNTSSGYRSMFLNTTGLYNTSSGSESLYSNSTGSYNTAIGRQAMIENTTGTRNTAIGSNALHMSDSSSSNTAVGAFAGYSALGSGNVFIGYRAGYHELDSNRLYIHNDSASVPLIYGEFDSSLVKINGRIIVGDNNTSIPVTGSVRWNDSAQDFEGYTGTEWKSLTYQGRTWGSNSISETSSLTASDGAADDHFATSVSISGDYAIVGAPDHDAGGNVNQGKAYVFRRSESNWIEEDILTASDGAIDDNFGSSVSISGDYAIVGAPEHDTGGSSNQGEAYVFHRSGTTWTEEAILIASDGAVGDWFGNSVSISGDYAVVGAFFHNIGGITDQGKAYVFHRSGTIWTEEDTLVASDGAANDRFGNSVSISGDYIVAGAYLHDQGTSADKGRAYAYHRSGSDWTQEASLYPADGATNDRFGTSVSISGDYAIVGSPQHNTGGNNNQGKAYVFHRSGSSWTQTGLTSSDGDSGDYFGSSVSISGDYGAIGARIKDIDGNVDQGKAYIFHRSSTMWTEEAILNASDGVANDNFGYSIAISGDYAVVGALYHDVGGNSDQGKAYIFRK